MMDSSGFEAFFSSLNSQETMDSTKRNLQDSGLIPSLPDQSLDLFQLSKSSFDFTMSQVLTPRTNGTKNGDMYLKPIASQQPKRQVFGKRKFQMVDKSRLFGIKPEIVTPAIYSHSQSETPSIKVNNLRSIEEIPSPYRNIFKFQYFNYLQSKVLDEVLYTDRSVVVSAPTGSGKTVVFEIALIRLLMKTEDTYHGKIIYMAPMKALCTERFQDWQGKFPDLKCLKVTGDSEIDDVTHLKDANLICTTPEKWDSMSRRWKDKKGFFHGIRLFLIDEKLEKLQEVADRMRKMAKIASALRLQDRNFLEGQINLCEPRNGYMKHLLEVQHILNEIHTLNDKNRGATVEAVVSRMKTLQTAATLDSSSAIRFVAVSATLPNYSDIAEWLSTPPKPATSFNIEEKHRPVKIVRFVIGYPFKNGSSDFRFDMNLSYRLRGIIDTHSHGKPALVFCSSRKSVIQSGEILSKNYRSFVTHEKALVLQQAAMNVREQKVSDLLNSGIGVHHAGLTIEDRQIVEDLFRNSQLPVLISTSTLAMGVNLPAHLVVIKSTHFYNMGAVEEYSDMQLLQMIGRAGRPQFDTSATAVIMTKDIHKSRYESLINGTQLVESSLHKNLIEHLNAEIVLQTITDMTMAVEWMRQTFLYVRVLKNPKHYGLPVGLKKNEVEKRLQDLCLKDLNLLTGLGLVKVEDESYAIIPQETGRLMARYCIAFETMKLFLKLEDHQESVADMIDVMSACAEFEDIQLRISEKKTLNSLNKDKSKESIRFPLKGKIKNKQMKVNCLIQAQMSCLPVQDFSLSQDVTKIFRVGQRVAKCLMELLYIQGSTYSLILHAVLVYKGLKTRLWFDSSLISRQLDGIGPTMSLALAKAGLNSFEMLEQAHPRDIEVIVNRHHPFGNQIKDCVSRLPRYELAVEQVNKHTPGRATLSICIDLLNRSRMDDEGVGGMAGSNHQALLLIGDQDNAVVFKWRIMDNKILVEGSWSRTVEVKRATAGPKLNISLLSLDWVGLDIQTEYEPVYTPGWTRPQNQNPASRLRESMDKLQQKKGLSNTPNPKATKDAVKRPQVLNGKASSKKPKVQFEDTSEKADVLSTILNSMDKTFPLTESRITLNKFAYEKPKSLSRSGIGHTTSNLKTIQSVDRMEKSNCLMTNPPLSNKLNKVDVSIAPENKLCVGNRHEDDWKSFDDDDDDLMWDMNQDFDPPETKPGDDFEHRNVYEVDYEDNNASMQTNVKCCGSKSNFLTSNTQEIEQHPSSISKGNQPMTKHYQGSNQIKVGYGFATPRLKHPNTESFNSLKKTPKEVSLPNPAICSTKPHQSVQFHQSNTSSHAEPAPGPQIMPSKSNSLQSSLRQSENNYEGFSVTKHSTSFSPSFPPKPYMMGCDVDDFMRQQGFVDADLNVPFVDGEGEERDVDNGDEHPPAISNSDEELYNLIEEHEINCSLPINNRPNSNMCSVQGSDTFSTRFVEISSNCSSPLTSSHNTALPLQFHGQGSSDKPFIVSDYDEISWSPLSSPRLSQQIPSHRPPSQQIPLNSQLSQQIPLNSQLSQQILQNSRLSQQIPLNSQLSQQIPLQNKMSQQIPPRNKMSQHIQHCQQKLLQDHFSQQKLMYNGIQISKQTPRSENLDRMQMKRDKNDTKPVQTVGEVEKNPTKVNSPHCYGLVQAWPRASSHSQNTSSRKTIQYLPEKGTHEEPPLSQEHSISKSNRSPIRPSPSMFVPQCQNSASESYVPGKLFEGIFDSIL